MRKAALIIVTLAVLVLPASLTASAAQTGVTTALAAPAPVSPWSLDFSVDHYLSHRDDVDAFTSFDFDGSWQFTSAQSIEVDQAITKLWTVDVGQNDVLPEDTRISHDWDFAKNVGGSGIDLGLRTGVFLPASQASRDQGLLFSPSTRLSISRSFFHDRLLIAYRPSILFNVNEYTSSIDGTPNTLWSITNSFLIKWEAIRKLRLTALAETAVNYREQMEYQTDPALSTGNYVLSLQLSYGISSNFAPHVAIEQRDGYIKDGEVQVYGYDPLNTRYIVGFDVSI